MKHIVFSRQNEKLSSIYSTFTYSFHYEICSDDLRTLFCICGCFGLLVLLSRCLAFDFLFFRKTCFQCFQARDTCFQSLTRFKLRVGTICKALEHVEAEWSIKERGSRSKSQDPFNICVCVCVCVCVFTCCYDLYALCVHAYVYMQVSIIHFLFAASNMLVCNQFLDVCMPTHMHTCMCVCVLCVCLFNHILVQYNVRACVFMPPVFRFHPDSSRCNRYASHLGPHRPASALDAAFA